jgi:hypothetical protein
MNVSRIIVGMAVCALSAQLSWGQEARPAGTKALGYLDSNGLFRPVGPMEIFDSNSAVAANPQTGTIVVNFNITIKSVIPSTSPVNCEVSAGVTEISGAGVNLISESAFVAATHTGNTAKCTVTIPYSWVLLNPTAATVSIGYGVSASKTPAPSTGLQSRSSSGVVANIPVPANGSTSTQTVNAVL